MSMAKRAMRHLRELVVRGVVAFLMPFFGSICNYFSQPWKCRSPFVPNNIRLALLFTYLFHPDLPQDLDNANDIIDGFEKTWNGSLQCPSIGAISVKNRFQSWSNIKLGSPIVDDPWWQYKSKSCSCMNSSVLIRRLSYSTSVNVAIVCTAGSPITSLSLNTSWSCTYISVSFLFRGTEVVM